MNTTQKKTKVFFQALFFYTLLVILWGAWVRISHSGDGCGDSWPLCQGQFVPDSNQHKTWVEYGHRLSSGLYGIAVIGLYLWCRKIYPPHSRERFWAGIVLIFTITEALLGAKLVLSGLVTTNDSIKRVVVMALHQLNSFLLTGSVACGILLPEHRCAPSLAGHSNLSIEMIQRTKQTAWPKWKLIFVIAFLLIGITGAWAALSSTLFQSSSVLDGIRQDFSDDSHYLIRLRILHPLFGLLIGLGIGFYFWLDGLRSESALRARLSFQTASVFILGVLFGCITLFSLSPIWMKISHLALAHLIWLCLLRWLTCAPELLNQPKED